MQIYDHEIHLGEVIELEKGRRFLAAQFYGAVLELAEPFALPNFRAITAWEALTCVGFHPTSRQLEAVVEIRRSSGYSGDLCADGSTEFVRFFVDWHDGVGFQDVGLASFRVFDVPTDHPIQHLVRLQLDEQNRALCCDKELLPTVRAVLGWNEIPGIDPDGDLPVYGNRLDAAIQIAPKFCLPTIDGASLLTFGVPSTLDPAFLAPPAAWSSLIKDYRSFGVEEERLTYPALSPMLDGVALDAGAVAGSLQADLAQFQELDLNVQGILETLAFGEQGKTHYEELVCVGFDSELDTVGAVIHVKRPAGYSGNLCRRGSTEYVRFWADWDDLGVWDDLGTVGVGVHDLSHLPAEGVHYAVSLPVDTSKRLRGCGEPRLVRIRASLSWERPPKNAERPETWGNLLDAWIRLRPQDESGDLVAELYRVGGVAPYHISPVTFLAYPSLGAINPGACSAAPKDRPFAGNVSVAGRIRSRNPGTIYYRVEYRPHVQSGPTVAWLPVTHQVSWRLDYPPPQHDITKTAHSVDGWFEYQEQLNQGFQSVYVVGEHLAVWGTRGLPDGAYDLRLACRQDRPLGTGSTFFYTNPSTILVDNTSFRVSGRIGENSVDLASDLDLVVEGASVECRRYQRGDIVKGRLRAVDASFHFWSLDLQPAGRTNGTTAVPRCRGYRSVGDTGDGDLAWTLETSNLQPCGYTLRLRAYDRAIVDSNGAYRHAGEKYVGLVVD